MQEDYWTQHNLVNALFVRKYSQWLGKKERHKSALFESVKEKGSKHVDIRRSGLISLNFHNYFSIVVFVITSLRRNSPRSLEPVNPLRLSDGGPGVVFHPNSAVPCCSPSQPNIRFLACGRAQPPDVRMINIRNATLAPAGEWMDYVFCFSSRLKVRLANKKGKSAFCWSGPKSLLFWFQRIHIQFTNSSRVLITLAHGN